LDRGGDGGGQLRPLNNEWINPAWSCHAATLPLFGSSWKRIRISAHFPPVHLPDQYHAKRGNATEISVATPPAKDALDRCQCARSGDPVHPRLLNVADNGHSDLVWTWRAILRQRSGRGWGRRLAGDAQEHHRPKEQGHRAHANARPHWRGASDLRNVGRTGTPRPVQADSWAVR